MVHGKTFEKRCSKVYIWSIGATQGPLQLQPLLKISKLCNGQQTGQPGHHGEGSKTGELIQLYLQVSQTLKLQGTSGDTGQELLFTVEPQLARCVKLNAYQ